MNEIGSMRKHVLACDLKDNKALIAEYEKFHAPGNVWPEVLQSLKESGILNMEIFRTGNRLIMVILVDEDFTFARKAELDASNPKVMEWETLMSKFQEGLPWAEEGQKWVLLEKVFDFDGE